MILTIYIPTYRRKELDACLASIVPQITRDVEVIISDNDPNGFAKEIASRYPKALYTRRYHNIEGDPNILRGLTQGSGRYVWIFGDDDTMLPGTINELIPMLTGVDRVLHWTANSREVNPGFDGTVRDYILGLTDRSLLTAATLITASVWRRDAMDIGAGLAKLDTHYPLAWASLNLQTIKVMSRPTITVGHEYSHGFNFFAKVIDQYLRALSKAHGLPEITWEQACAWNFVNVSK